jgi:omega-amidase
VSSLNVTIVQTAIDWENKAANLQALEEKINSLSATTEIVVLPEMFSTGFSMNAALLAEKMSGRTLAWMSRIAAAKKIILTGSVIIEEEGKYYNRLIWMLPNQQYGVYDKRHLFSYAQENEHYTPGNKRLIASVKGWKINVQICYDLRFPVWARQTKLSTTEATTPSYDVLLYVANWPEQRSHAWKSLLVARAIENQCYVVAVNRVGKDGNNIYYSGDSMVVNPVGEMLYHQAHEEAVFTVTLEKENLTAIRTQFPFLNDGDAYRVL